METFRFINFPVYIKAKKLYQYILLITQDFKDYALKDQTRRAVLSIILNITEGSAKKSDKEFARFLQISLGSVNELVACLDIMIDNNFISKNNYHNLLEECDVVAKQLGGFSKKLRSVNS